jgi:hypothetical protein
MQYLSKIQSLRSEKLPSRYSTDMVIYIEHEIEKCPDK